MISSRCGLTETDNATEEDDYFAFSRIRQIFPHVSCQNIMRLVSVFDKAFRHNFNFSCDFITTLLPLGSQKNYSCVFGMQVIIAGVLSLIFSRNCWQM